MINISFQYSRFIKVTVEHEYYSDKKFKDVEVRPTDATKELLKRMNFEFRTEENGFALLFDTDKDLSLISKLNFITDEKLTFYLFNKNSCLYHISDFNTNIIGKSFIFTIDKPSKDSVLCLHQDDFLKSEDTCSFSATNLAYENIGKDKIQLKGQNTSVDITPDNEGNALVTLGGLNAGLYELESKGKTIEKIYKSDTDLTIAPLMVFDLPMNSELFERAKLSLENNTGITENEYIVRINNRSTIWKYLVISKYVKELEKTEVKSTESKVQFKGPDKEELSTGDIAYVFQSDKELPLLQFAEFTFQLNKKKAGVSGSKTIIEKMPVPGIDVVREVQEGKNNKFYSEIYLSI